ncbi:hypothetical protein HD553DRAFT_365001 [Filobasidium floriforme]|uniref:uncharacterized protein n=1 Tax=Filobasidium floriforme TaxID=5210 RepID=UPI001E8EC6C1|nr:uncharacterized protein HD553DRAFT_365001 [Filobasidium floriforme]KAH8089097.1 hypothetical protein HD553DRAFT_365001 [Filobasidium floriforme]
MVMIKVKFNNDNDGDKNCGREYPIEVLKLSSVLRDSMEFATDGVINLPEKRHVMEAILDFMQTAYDSPTDTTKLNPVSHGIVVDFVALADKYDVTGTVHNALSLAIIRALHDSNQSDSNYDCLVYAFRARDAWLCQYVIRHLRLNDPADWEWRSVEVLGFKAWHCLVKAYPRVSGMGVKVKWECTAEQIDFKTFF